jgi:hypothetical protein
MDMVAAENGSDLSAVGTPRRVVEDDALVAPGLCGQGCKAKNRSGSDEGDAIHLTYLLVTTSI